MRVKTRPLKGTRGISLKNIVITVFNNGNNNNYIGINFESMGINGFLDALKIAKHYTRLKFFTVLEYDTTHILIHTTEGL